MSYNAAMKYPKVVAVLLIAVVGWAALRAQADRPAQKAQHQEPAPSLTAQVVSVTCDPNAGRTRANITIRNTGSTPIQYPKAYVRFGSDMHDSYLSPDSVPPGSLASGRVYSPTRGGSTSCELVSVQERNGVPVVLSR